MAHLPYESVTRRWCALLSGLCAGWARASRLAGARQTSPTMRADPHQGQEARHIHDDADKPHPGHSRRQGLRRRPPLTPNPKPSPTGSPPKQPRPTKPNQREGAESPAREFGLATEAPEGGRTWPRARRRAGMSARLGEEPETSAIARGRGRPGQARHHPDGEEPVGS